MSSLIASLSHAERAALSAVVPKVYEELRALQFEDFAKALASLPSSELPLLSSALPKMPDTEIQKAWCGTSGDPLLLQSCAFIRSVIRNYEGITGKPASNIPVLDFGCGWGRLSRLMYYYCDPEYVVGVDAWDSSIEQCRLSGMGSNFYRSEVSPTTLPVADRLFELAYSFSVFTHLAPKTAIAALTAIRKHMASGGVLVITIRTEAYWNSQWIRHPDAAELERRHAEDGIAFVPHPRAGGEGDGTFGDTSISLEWLSANAPGWKIEASEIAPEDPQQLYVFMRAV